MIKQVILFYNFIDSSDLLKVSINMINIENKFMTIGVKENISLDVQLFMWNEIE